MISIYMFLTALATTALGKGSIECNFSQPTGSGQCFGAVGQPLLFLLPNTPNTDISLKKDGMYMILKATKQTVSLGETYVNHSELFTSGILNLGNATKRHTGDYRLEEYRSNGILLREVQIHLEIQAPVSKPDVSQTCLSPEQMKVSCSSEGDGVEFNLILDGQLLIQTRNHSLSASNRTTNMQLLTGSSAKQDKSSVSNVTISLHGQLTGKLTCSVQNNISRGETVIHLEGCKASTLPVVSVAVRGGVITLLLLALCLGIFRLHNKTRPITVNEEGSSKNSRFQILGISVVKYCKEKPLAKESHTNNPGVSKDAILYSTVTYRISLHIKH